MMHAQEYYEAAMKAVGDDWDTICSNFKIAAERGHADALFQLAWHYTCRHVTGCGAREAYECYLQAALKGHVKAQYALSECFNKGSGCAKNRILASLWCKRAADAGNVVAQYRLLLLYNIGTYAPKTKEEAHEWFYNALSLDGWIGSTACTWYNNKINVLPKDSGRILRV